MFVRKIDLLSAVPQILIFNQGSNKTVFGGVLSIIYVVIFLLIAIAYLVDYYGNDKYEVEYGIRQEVLSEEKEKEIIENPDYNPNLNFRVVLRDSNLNPLSDRFVLFHGNDTFFSEQDIISYNITGLNFGVMYRCENKSCLINEEDKVDFGYSLYLIYRGYVLDHQGDIPLHKAEDDFAMNSMFFFQKPTIQYFQWGIIKYAEEKGLLGVFANLIGGEDEDLVGGYFKSKNHFFLDGIMDEEKMIEEINGTYYKLLGYFSGILDSFQHERYKRTKRSIMDVFADVSALAMTILSIFAFVFGNYYSGNFDNYKIIEKVLSKEKKINRFVNKDISEDTNDDKKKHIELIDNNGKSEALIDSNTEGKDTIIPAKKDIEEINVNREEDRTIPKLRFIDFIMNSFYNDNCCKSSNRQQIISSCNDLVAKYYTIEDIIYNQIKIENLLKDYKWNDPKLNNIENNEAIIELKSYYNI